MNVKELAKTMSEAFETRTRTNGDSFKCLKDGSPEWMNDVIHSAHGDMGPDDFRYKIIAEFVDAIGENEEIDDAIDSVCEPDIYTHELMAWLGSRADRYGYCDEAKEERAAEYHSIIEWIQDGQRAEKREICGLVLPALEDIARDDDDDSDDDDDTSNFTTPAGWTEID